MLKIPTKSKETSLVELGRKFLTVKTAQQLTEQTLTDYKYQIVRFINASRDSCDYATLEEDVLSYFSSIPSTSPARYNKPYQYLSAWFSWMVDEGIIPKNPLKANKLKKRKDDGNIKPASIDEIKKFIKAIDTKSFTGFRDLCLINLILDTGIRSKEALSLKNSDYSSGTKSIVIDKMISKTRSQRTVYLNNKTCELLDELIRIKPKDWHDWLFPNYEGNQLVTEHLDKAFQKYSKISGVKITPYQLRHTFATIYLQQGGDTFTLQKQMGHADLRMTKRYAEISDIQVKNAHKEFSPALLLQTTRKR
jgi:site-specific recombinase XerD